ncbi:MAG: hypothetical protein QOD83_3261, partial [Solirubrobacteraceae bacterium]|nr:hypothetical protein [Solirubrobacteraceae bacterium]
PGGVRDARSDSYARILLGRRTGFRRESPLSKIERGPRAAQCLIADALARGGQVPAASSTDVVHRGVQSAVASAQQKPASSRATATATIVRRLPRS